MKHLVLVVMVGLGGCTGLEYDDVEIPQDNDMKSENNENLAPMVVITAPDDGAQVSTNVCFEGAASDHEDGDITQGVAWTSDPDGLLGVGASVCKALSTGPHEITASVSDASGTITQNTIQIEVQ